MADDRKSMPMHDQLVRDIRHCFVKIEDYLGDPFVVTLLHEELYHLRGALRKVKEADFSTEQLDFFIERLPELTRPIEEGDHPYLETLYGEVDYAVEVLKKRRDYSEPK